VIIRPPQKNGRSNSYQDLVIKDGKFVGDFDHLYENFDDPWKQSDKNIIDQSRRALCIHHAKKLAKEYREKYNDISKPFTALELGCGFGYLTAELNEEGLNCVGIDISHVAIQQASRLHPNSKFCVAEFGDYKVINEVQPNLFIFAEITWYVLPKLKEFFEELMRYKSLTNKQVFVFHSLVTYPVGIQKYGTDYFTNLEEILSYFEPWVVYKEFGEIFAPLPWDPESRGTYFLAEVK